MNYFFEHNGIALFNVPTGAGKTFLAIYLLKEIFKDKPRSKCLIVCPKNVIVDMWLKELQDVGFTWNKLGIYNGECKEYSQITVTTTSSVHRINLNIFDIIIADEIHNMGTTKQLEVLKHEFKYKIGLSATPNRSDMKHWKIYEYFNYNVFEYSVKEALKDEVLNKFDLYDVEIQMDDEYKLRYDDLTMSIGSLMRSIGGFNRFMSLPNSDPIKLKLMKYIGERKEMIWNHPEKMQAVADICKFFPDNKVVVFSQYNKMTNMLYYHLSSEKLKVEYIHSNIHESKKEQVLKDFSKDKFNILLSTKMLDEGYNLPSIDIGIILAGERTKRQTIQRLGRVLRKKETKSKLFQLYIKNTFEEEVSKERSKLFKELCEEYKKIEV